MRKSDFILEKKMAELNQNKVKIVVQNLFLIGNTVAYWTVILKSIGKFPKKVAHASFLQCSAYIALGQDDWLRKINFKVYGIIEWEESGKAW